MGRYYSGDIEGKFMFGVQSSDAADRFGVSGQEPSVINYYFGEEDLEGVENEIKKIEEDFGDKLRAIEEFFDSRNGYTNEMLEEFGITLLDLRDYADLILGRKIRDCIKENGQCEFEAEI